MLEAELVDRNSRLGWEPSMDYMGGARGIFDGMMRGTVPQQSTSLFSTPHSGKALRLVLMDCGLSLT